MVGWPNSPSIAGSGGLARTVPRLPSRLSQQRGLLAADIRAGAEPHLQREMAAGAADVVAQIPGGGGRRDRTLQRAEGVRIFGAAVDEALGGIDCQPGDRHALDQAERIALHQHAVGEGAAVALVGIADDVALLRRSQANGVPLDPGGEPGATPAAQSGQLHHVDDRRAVHGQRPVEPGIAAMGPVVGHAQRIDHAAAAERQPRLPLLKRVLLGFANRKRMLRALQEPGVEQACHVRHAHRTIPRAATGRVAGNFNLNQRLKPHHAPGSGPHQFDGKPPGGGFPLDRFGDAVRPQGQRGSVGRDEDAGHACASATKSCRAAASTRPSGAPSNSAAGAQAHSPRQ